VNQPASVGVVYEHLERAKRTGPFITNFYPSQDKLQRWLDRGELFLNPLGDVLFVLRRDRDFLHLYYLASSAADLPAALDELDASVRETTTVDILGKREQVAPLAEKFLEAGFADLCALHRMTRLGDETRTAATADPQLVFADKSDGNALAGMLETALDRFAEQIPDADEMARAAADRKVLIIRSGTAIAGMLFYEVTGQSSLLRHWLVDPAHRDQRVGARLMRRYFAECVDVRRFLLWVISDNDNAIDRYKHYGYQQDGMIDQVMIRRPS